MTYTYFSGGFYEGLLSKEFQKRNKNTYFIEAGVKIYLYLDSQNNLKPKRSF